MRVNRRQMIGGGVVAAATAATPLRALGIDDKVFVNSIVIEDNSVWIAAKIGDRGPYLFVVDTGGHMSLINDDSPSRSAWKSMPGRQNRGIGGVSDFPWYNAGTVTLASGIRFPSMLFAGTRVKFGKDGVGAFGAGLFTSYDSDLDFVAGQWRTYPSGRPNFDGLTKLRSRFTDLRGGQRIIANATVDGFAGDFLLDTGAPGELLLYGRAAAKSGLWNDTTPYAPMYTNGIGKNRVPGRLVRAKRLQIGPFGFDNPLVRLSEPGTPGSDFDGIIGLQTLEKLHLSTDISANAVYAAPNNRAVPERTYPLSGLWLDDARGKVTVADVGRGSPAAAAGVQVGDVLPGALRDMIAATGGGPGKQVKLSVERAGATRELSYTLKPWL